MKTLNLIYVALILVVFASCSKEPLEDVNLTGKSSVEFYENDHINIVKFEADIMQYVNDHRESMGLQRVEKSFTVQKYSDSHTEYMISKELISHDNWESRAGSLLNEVGGTRAAENVAYGYKTGLQAVLGWLDSEGHRNNIENPAWNFTGITAKIGDDGLYYISQIFVKQ